MPRMLGGVGTVLEMINSRKIALSTLQGHFERIDAIDSTDLGNP
jgi:hypothetical protein